LIDPSIFWAAPSIMTMVLMIWALSRSPAEMIWPGYVVLKWVITLVLSGAVWLLFVLLYLIQSFA
jgi:hypothetical protein